MSHPVSLTTISVPILVVVALLVAVASSSYAASVFLMSRSMATQEHLEIVAQIEKNHIEMTASLEENVAALALENSRTYLESKIDNKKAEMHWMQLQGIETQTDRSHYDLLEFSVKHMSQALEELR